MFGFFMPLKVAVVELIGLYITPKILKPISISMIYRTEIDG